MVAECYLPSVNGVTMSVVRSAAHLASSGHIVEVMAPAPSRSSARRPGVAPSITGPEIAHEVRSVALPRYRSLRVGVASTRRIERIIRQSRPDVVHLAAPTVLGGGVSSVAKQLGVPTVAVFQTDLAGFVTNYRGLGSTGEPIWRRLRRIHNRADLTLAPTPTLARELRSRGFHRVEVWGRGVDQEQFHPSRRNDDLRAGWCGTGQPGGDTSDGDPVRPPVVVGFVGRLAAEKQVERLASLAGNPHVRLVIVGDGPERGRLEAALPSATFTGMLTGDRLGEAMASLDVMVQTGTHETFCQTVQEAMAAGVAVIAPAAGGPVDLIDHRVTGMLFRPDDQTDLVDTVNTVVADDGLRARLAQAGRASIRNRTWMAIGEQLVDHYRQAVLLAASNNRVRPIGQWVGQSGPVNSKVA